MSTTFQSASLKAVLASDYRKSSPFGVATKDDQGVKYTLPFTQGSGADQLEVLYRAQHTLTLATTTVDLDLAGVLADVFGDTINFTAIKMIWIHNTAVTGGEEIRFGGAVSNPWQAPFAGSAAPTTAKFEVGPRGILIACNPEDGYAVVPGSSDVLRLTHAGAVGDIDVNVVLMGNRS